MKFKTKHTVIGILALVLCLATFVIVNGMRNAEASNSNVNIISDANYIKLSYDEIVLAATHIIDAEYVGKSGGEFMFKPVKTIKGKLDTDAENVIYVEPSPENFGQEPEDYKKGGLYMLFLEKHRMVFDEHDKYVQVPESLVASGDEKWEYSHTRAQTVLAETGGESRDSYGLPYTHSTVMSDILQVTENIFVVHVEDIFAESKINPTTVYSCKVVKTIKNKPVYGGDILITLFNGTVKVGGEYVVLLADATESAPVYVVSSKNSVYSWKEAETIPELKELLDNAVAFKSDSKIKTDAEILAEEQEARR